MREGEENGGHMGGGGEGRGSSGDGEFGDGWRWSEEMLIFFFKQKTAYEIKECDWSSDVCSSDL